MRATFQFSPSMCPGGKTGERQIGLQIAENGLDIYLSITFDCGKEFSNWRLISNQSDMSIYFADPGTPSQRGLNEHSNGLLRRDGLHKQMNFNQIDQAFVSSVAARRNHIHRKSLNYQTPLEVFLSYIDDGQLSSLF